MSILEEAKRLTSQDRNKQYGDAHDNHQRIVDYWNVYLEHKFGRKLFLNEILTPKDAMFMMALLKQAREDYQHVADSNVDHVAYIHLANEEAENYG